MSVITLTESNFESEVMKSDKPVLIDFYADWCGPCRMVSPLVDEIAAEYSNLKVCKVNVDSEPQLAEKFDVTSIPALFAVNRGRVINKNVGAVPKQLLLDMFGLK